MQSAKCKEGLEFGVWRKNELAERLCIKNGPKNLRAIQAGDLVERG